MKDPLIRAVVIIVLVLLVIGMLPTWGFGWNHYGWGPAGGLGGILAVLIVLILLEKV